MAEEAVSAESDSGHDEDCAAVGCDTRENQVHIWLRPQHTLNSGDVHPFHRRAEWI
jgi:hypothetical protein